MCALLALHKFVACAAFAAGTKIRLSNKFVTKFPTDLLGTEFLSNLEYRTP
uniref:Uncharacterized protein n=1 Tax=Arundo donax TaxID=35708 RepID=A0A0A9F941_ARUDO